jgi:phospholipid/cholesterol/gamma-HCH transport system substrate-binding protein
MKKLDLAETWERIKTTPGLKRDTLAAAGMVAAGVAGTVLILTSLANGGPFESRTVVKADFTQVTGLNPDSKPKVTIAGVEVGYVQDADTTDRGEAEVTLNIEAGHPVYQNARAMIRPKNPLNDMQIELNPGSPPAPAMPDEGVIPSSQTERPIEADEVLAHLDDRTQTAMTSLLTEADTALVRAPQELPGGLAGTADTVVKLRPVVDALQTRRDNISQLVTALGEISNAAGTNDVRLARLADSTQQTLGVLGRNDGALQASLDQMPGLSDDLKNSLTSTQRLTQQLDPTLDNLHRASEDLPPALKQFDSTVNNLGETIDAAAPVVDKAKPVVGDLRPLVDDVNSSMKSIVPVADRLPRDTGIVTSYLTELRAFVYNTQSVFGAGDASGNIIRGHLTVPSGLFGLPQQPGYAPGAENGQVGASQNPTSPKPERGTP